MSDDNGNGSDDNSTTNNNVNNKISIKNHDTSSVDNFDYDKNKTDVIMMVAVLLKCA